jgi:ADP-ribosylation factor related protein 1
VLAFAERMIEDRDLDGVPLLVLVNKVDNPHAMTNADVKLIFNESAHLLGSRDCKVNKVSALTGDNVEESLLWLAGKVQENAEIRPPKMAD